jgi:hypothetical protein
VRLKPIIVDMLVAVVIAAVVLIISPGLAVTGILALVFLLVCGISLLFDSHTARRNRTGGRARPVRRR